MYVVPFALGTWLFIEMGANMGAISMFLAVACLLTFFQAFFNSEKVCRALRSVSRLTHLVAVKRPAG